MGSYDDFDVGTKLGFVHSLVAHDVWITLLRVLWVKKNEVDDVMSTSNAGMPNMCVPSCAKSVWPSKTAWLLFDRG
jgi:hypothetical protein